ncbi:hypothetical protein ACFWA4_05920 [Streptomyces sp. NPDC060011]|uniref:hypothetical protein n=1 Tax=Streptomyces sp. NPDC060011 TaxID=3347037 RepID=UPI0036995FAD
MPLFTPSAAAGWNAQDHGLIAWSSDPSLNTGTATTVNGTVYLTRLNIRNTTTLSTVWWMHTTGPTTPTAGQNFAGVYDSAGTLLSSVNVDAKTTNGPQSATLGAPQAIAGGTFVWVAFVFNAATPPVLMRAGGQSAAGNIVNLTTPAVRFAVNGTAQTSLPVSITPASNSQTGVFAIWAAVS